MPMTRARLAIFLSGAITSGLLIVTAPLHSQRARDRAHKQPASAAAREELLAALHRDAARSGAKARGGAARSSKSSAPRATASASSAPTSGPT